MKDTLVRARVIARRGLALGCAVLALSTYYISSAGAYTNTGNGIRLNAVEHRIAVLINEARTSRSIPALTVSAGTTDVARRWSTSQATRNVLEHNPNVAAQVQAAGSSNWQVVQENVGRGTTADALFAAYMNSASHRANILDPDVRFLGIGWAERPDGTGYNTQVFVDQYSTSYGATRVSGYGGQADKRAITATTSLANFEAGQEPRGFTRVTSSGLYTSALAVDSTSVADGAGKFTVKETASGTTGSGEVVLRDAVDLAGARAVTVRLYATTASAKSIVVGVVVRTSFGTSVSLGSVTVPHGKTVTSTLALPAAAKNFRNEFAFSVSRTALKNLGTTTASRVANVAIKDVTVVV